jgi:hypothetical protein
LIDKNGLGRWRAVDQHLPMYDVLSHGWRRMSPEIEDEIVIDRP